MSWEIFWYLLAAVLIMVFVIVDFKAVLAIEKWTSKQREQTKHVWLIYVIQTVSQLLLPYVFTWLHVFALTLFGVIELRTAVVIALIIVFITMLVAFYAAKKR